jgi:hypothetical protein
MGWAEAVFILGSFVAIMAAVIVLGWQGFVTWRSRTSVAREEAYRKLAEQATEAQSRTRRLSGEDVDGADRVTAAHG